MFWLVRRTLVAVRRRAVRRRSFGAAGQVVREAGSLGPAPLTGPPRFAQLDHAAAVASVGIILAGGGPRRRNRPFHVGPLHEDEVPVGDVLWVRVVFDALRVGAVGGADAGDLVGPPGAVVPAFADGKGAVPRGAVAG